MAAVRRIDKCLFCLGAVNQMSLFSRSGHLRHCKPYQQLREAETEGRKNTVNAEFDLNEYPQFAGADLEDMIPYLSQASDLYLRRQRTYMSKELYDTMQVGMFKLLCGRRAPGNKEILLRLAIWVSRATLISQEDATDLVVLIKIITYINRKEIALPHRFEYIKEKLLSSFKWMLPSAIDIEIPFPIEIFGSLTSQMPVARGVYCNILELIGNIYTLIVNRQLLNYIFR